MNNVPINGLPLLLVESCTLLAAFAAVFALTRVVHRSLTRPQWLDWVLASNSRAVLFVIVAALSGRALLLPFIGVPEPRINDEYSYLLMADTVPRHNPKRTRSSAYSRVLWHQ